MMMMKMRCSFVAFTIFFPLLEERRWWWRWWWWGGWTGATSPTTRNYIGNNAMCALHRRPRCSIFPIILHTHWWNSQLETGERERPALFVFLNARPFYVCCNTQEAVSLLSLFSRWHHRGHIFPFYFFLSLVKSGQIRHWTLKAAFSSPHLLRHFIKVKGGGNTL